MRTHGATAAVLGAAGLWAIAATVLWGLLGWQIGPAPPPPGGRADAGELLYVLSLVWIQPVLLWAVGRPLVERAFGRVDVPGRIALAYLAGSAVMGIALGWGTFVLPMNVLLYLPLVLGAVVVGNRVRGRMRTAGGPWWEGWETAVMVGLLAVPVAVAAFAPAVESDGLRYHLAAASRWREAGGFILLPLNANSNLPAMQSVLAGSALGAGDPLVLGRVYQMMGAVSLGALALVAGSMGHGLVRSMAARRAVDGMAAEAAARWARMLAAAMVLALPTVNILGAWPFADVPAVALFLGGVYTLMPGVIRGGGRRAALAGLLLGGAVATKISLLPLVGLVGLAEMARIAASGPRALPRLVLIVAAGMAVVGPWLLKNGVYHGNPLYPLAWGVLGGAEWSEANEAFYRDRLGSKGMGTEWWWLLRSPWDMTVSWARFEGHNPGPVLLGLLPLGLGAVAFRRRGPVMGLWALLVVGWIVWFFTYQSVRFFIPMLVLVGMLGIATGMRMALGVGPRGPRWVAGVVAVVLVAGYAWPLAYRLQVSHVYRAVLGVTPPEVAITRKLNSYPAMLWLRENTRRGEPVVYIGEHRTFYAEGFRPLASDWFDTPSILAELRRHGTDDELLAAWSEKGVRYVLVNQAELGKYEEAFFAPRFTPEEYARFAALRERLLEDVAFSDGAGVFVARVPPLAEVRTPSGSID